MPQPTAGDSHVNAILTSISIAYMQDAEGVVADRVFPNLPVQKQSDRYFAYDRADFFRNQYRKRAESTPSAGGGYKLDSTPNYFCEVWALHKDISDRLRTNEDSPLNSDRDAAIWLAQQAMLSREVNWAAKYFTTGVWKGIDGSTGDITGVSASPSTNQVLQWSDSHSDPVGDVKRKTNLIAKRTGKRANKLVMGREVWTAVTEHPSIIDRVKYGQSVVDPTVLNRKAVAALMEVGEILVMDGIEATSPENKDFETSMTFAFIGGTRALLTFANPTPSIQSVSGGYTFSWRGVGNDGAGAQGQRIKQFRMEELESDRVEGQMAYDQKLVAPDLGILFDSIVAA